MSTMSHPLKAVTLTVALTEVKALKRIGHLLRPTAVLIAMTSWFIDFCENESKSDPRSVGLKLVSVRSLR